MKLGGYILCIVCMGGVCFRNMDVKCTQYEKYENEWAPSVTIYLQEGELNKYGYIEGAWEDIHKKLDGMNVIFETNGMKKWKIESDIRIIPDYILLGNLDDQMTSFDMYRMYNDSYTDTECGCLFISENDNELYVGMAYMGSVCLKHWYNITWACNIIVQNRDYASNILAHEFGHVLGSDHINPPPDDLMNPKVKKEGGSIFTCKSKSQMVRNCMDNEVQQNYTCTLTNNAVRIVYSLYISVCVMMLI